MGERRGTKALELWCRRMTEGYPGVKIDNMTTSWRDGLAFCAMVHHFKPELIDFDKLNKNDVYYNNDLAFRTAEVHLGIPALLDADDMASYEVPDRLSILTYLSQYYQVFASQGSPNRLKRTSTTAEKSQIGKTPGPPPKMAHVVGVPKRDPCQKCALPVFLAERLTVGKHVYHRTCLKCARCGSQLTLGSFYETETDGEFCCETCPDEESSLSTEVDDGVVLKREGASGGERSSIADRLAFFESSDKKLLQKSVSDEEKTKSLKRLNETAPYKMNSALSNFMNETLNDAAIASAGASSHVASTLSSAASTDHEMDEEPPELPTTLPPMVLNDTADDELDDGKAISVPPLDAVPSISPVVHTEISPKEPETKKFVVSVKLEPLSSPTQPSDDEMTDEEKEAITIPTTSAPADHTIISDSTDCSSNIVTKDNSDDDVKARTIEIELEDQSEITNRLSVVRARLHQFEVIANESTDSLRENHNQPEIELKIESKEIATKEDNELEADEKEEVPIVNLESIKKEDNNDASIHETIEVESSQIETETTEPIEKETKEELQVPPIVDSEPIDMKKEETEAISPAANTKPATQEYPDDLNPFGSDDEAEEQAPADEPKVTPAPRKLSNHNSDKDRPQSLNPFDSSDDDIEIEKAKVKPPRPPPPKISKNPFGSESENEEVLNGENNTPSNDVHRGTPVPAPRSSMLSKNPTPEATPRLSKQTFSATTPLNNSGEYYGSSNSLNTPYSLQRQSDGRGSNNSLTSSTGTIRSRKSRKAPLPPPMRELFPSTETVNSSLKSTPASSTCTTPRSQRKKRLAPPPPKPARLDPNASPATPHLTGSKNLHSHPLQSDLDKLSDEEKALLEGQVVTVISDSCSRSSSPGADDSLKHRRLIALDERIIEDAESSNDIRRKEEENVVYRRKIIPIDDLDLDMSNNRQLEKLKDNKEANNRNRQSQVSLGAADDGDQFVNKSSHGKWKRRKGPAPSLPVPPRKVLQMLPLQEIRHELDIIEVQQQGLEKQGVILEKMIRERCEGQNGELAEEQPGAKPTPNTKEVEDLILQLFELVNEKNELFRRQAELMYLRRQHRLEQEQADIEYEIRVLMAQPERNKTDSDKAREEALIARMVEVVQLRNEVIECLEMDRLREAEEDLSIKQRLELHSAKRDEELCNQTPTKLSKKEKKKQKEVKKLGKSKKLDADKDADESELDAEKLKLKKKKKKFLF